MYSIVPVHVQYSASTCTLHVCMSSGLLMNIIIFVAYKVLPSGLCVCQGNSCICYCCQSVVIFNDNLLLVK